MKSQIEMSHARQSSEHAPQDYTDHVVIHASQKRVFDAIATAQGLRAWWTARVEGTGEAAGVLRLDFDGMGEHIVLRVERADPPSLVQWLCLIHTGLPEWAGTRMRFDLTELAPQESELNFRHIGLTPVLDCYDDCTLGWDCFLESLIAYVEQGTGMPFGS